MRLLEFSDQKSDIRSIVKVLQQKMGRLQRVGGPSRVYEIEGTDLVGAVYVIGDTLSAIGVACNKSTKQVKKLYLWSNNFCIFNSPDYEIDLPDVVNNDLADTIVSMLHSKKTGTVAVGSSMNEARRSTDEEFIKMARDMFGAKASKLSLVDLNKVAIENDVQIPSQIKQSRDYKALKTDGRTDPHHWNLSDGSASGEEEATNTAMSAELGAPVETKPEYSDDYQEVLDLAKAKSVSKMAAKGKVYLMGRKSNGAFFRIPNLETYSAQLERLLVNQLEANDPNRQNMDEQYDLLRDKVRLVAGGKSAFIKSLLIMGAPSSGKTFSVMSELKSLGLKAGRDYAVKKGKISVPSMYRTFIEQIDGLVIFDDADSVFDDKNGLNMLKNALDTYPVREIGNDVRGTINTAVMEPEEREEFVNSISRIFRNKPEEGDLAKFEKYLKKKKKSSDNEDSEFEDYDEVDDGSDAKLFEIQQYLMMHLPNLIDFKGRVIFISNMDESEMDSAILTRTFIINMNFTSGEMLDYIDKIKNHIVTPNLSDEEKQEVMDYVRDLWTIGKLKRQVNFRLIQQAFDLRLTSNWKKLLGEL